MRTICVSFDLMLDAHRRKFRGVMNYALKVGWNVEAIGGYLAPDLRSPSDFNAYDGIILDKPQYLSEGSWEDVTRSIVLIDTDPQSGEGPRGCPEIHCDSRAVGEMAAEALASLRAASYVFVPGFTPDFWSAERGHSFFEGLRRRGLQGDFFGQNDFFDQSDFFRHDVSLLETERDRLAEWLLSRPRPVAVFAANDAVAAFVYAACRRVRLSIPDDVYVLGVDNDETICDFSRPTLSSVLVDFESCGYRAAELLDGILGGRRRARSGGGHTFSPLSVVHRTSTRPRPPQTDVRLSAALDVIERDACRGLTVSGLARSVGVSRRTLELLFLPLGKTAAYCLTEAKLQRVCGMLLSSSLPITRIVAECGFCSEVYLAGLFKRRFCTTMSAFRTSARRAAGGRSLSAQKSPENGV